MSKLRPCDFYSLRTFADYISSTVASTSSSSGRTISGEGRRTSIVDETLPPADTSLNLFLLSLQGQRFRLWVPPMELLNLQTILLFGVIFFVVIEWSIVVDRRTPIGTAGGAREQQPNQRVWQVQLEFAYWGEGKKYCIVNFLSVKSD